MDCWLVRLSSELEQIKHHRNSGHWDIQRSSGSLQSDSTCQTKSQPLRATTAPIFNAALNLYLHELFVSSSTQYSTLMPTRSMSIAGGRFGCSAVIWSVLHTQSISFKDGLTLHHHQPHGHTHAPTIHVTTMFAPLSRLGAARLLKIFDIGVLYSTCFLLNYETPHCWLLWYLLRVCK